MWTAISSKHVKLLKIPIVKSSLSTKCLLEAEWSSVKAWTSTYLEIGAMIGYFVGHLILTILKYKKLRIFGTDFTKTKISKGAKLIYFNLKWKVLLLQLHYQIHLSSSLKILNLHYIYITLQVNLFFDLSKS